MFAILTACGSSASRNQTNPEALYSSISRQLDGGEYEDAIDASRKAWLRSPDSEWGWRFKLQHILALLYTRHFERAEALLKEGLPPAYSALRPRYQYLKAYLLDHEGDASATALFKAAIVSARNESDPQTEAEGLLFLAGDYSQPDAQQMADQALQVARRNGLAFQEAAATLQLGMIALQHERYADAIVHFLESASLARHLQAHYLEVASLGNLGECYFRLGDFDRALRALEKAQPLLRANDPRNLRVNVNNELGDLYLLRQDNAEAIRSFRHAFDIAKADETLSGYAPTANNLAEALIEAHNLNEAEKYSRLANQALKSASVAVIADAQLNQADISAGRGRLLEAEAGYRKTLALLNPEPSGSTQWRAHAQLAFLEERLGKVSEAREHFNKALETIEANRSQQRAADFQITFLSALIRFYQEYVEFLLRQNDQQKALAVADSSRASVLTQSQNMISSRKQPRFAAKIQKQAGVAKSALLFYWLAPNASYVWAITPQGTVCERLPRSQAEIERDVHSYQSFIQDQHLDMLKPVNPVGIRLYETLIGPIASRLKPGVRVVIVPDGALHGLNFETLLVKGDNPHYWLDDAMVTVAPSLGILVTRNSGTAVGLGALIVGDPVYKGTEYPDLPSAGPEIRRVNALFPKGTVVLTQQNARLDAYRNARPELFSLIHFSAHVDADAQSPLDSAIILSASDKGMRLYARDVMATPLSADLVTVSGCRSSGSGTLSGEGMVGFAWAAFEAGARNAVTSLWAVDDESTADLMDHFYGEVNKGQSYAEALRGAKREMLHSVHPKPYYWAPFQLYIRSIGDARTSGPAR